MSKKGMNRRNFLQLGGMSLALSMAPGAQSARRWDGPRGGRSRMDPRPGTRAQTDTPTIVFVFERGGADGLNQVIPLEPGAGGEHELYRDFRPTIGVPSADIDSAGTRLHGPMGEDLQWGLHPRMSALIPHFEAGELAILPDVHYDNASRSHFDGQNFYENGVPFDKFLPTGWMNRHLQTSPGADQLRAIAFETITPEVLRGDYPSLAFSDLSSLRVSGSDTRNQEFLDAMEASYANHELLQRKLYDQTVGGTGRALIEAIRAIEQAEADGLLPGADPAAQLQYDGITQIGANSQYHYFGVRMRDLAKLIKSNQFGIELAVVNLHSWDTHRDQDGAYHAHPNLSEALARGLSGFVTDLGDEFMQNVIIVVMTEFGRTSQENGSAGTDHGSAMATYVMGHASKLNGRRVIHGDSGWAGLADRRDNRDLKHSTDYRDVLAEIVRKHLGNDSPDIFPGHVETPAGVIV
jgi:uncharacterized protein (DUF1501 family)